ncbi:hypothetical protein GJ496_009446 [Pomphorhynchus laevis]|nr:hypothetical protein GJ496_009446 [Pomphorhynchus laevis]
METQKAYIREDIIFLKRCKSKQVVQTFAKLRYYGLSSNRTHARWVIKQFSLALLKDEIRYKYCCLNRLKPLILTCNVRIPETLATDDKDWFDLIRLRRIQFETIHPQQFRLVSPMIAANMGTISTDLPVVVSLDSQRTSLDERASVFMIFISGVSICSALLVAY